MELNLEKMLSDIDNATPFLKDKVLSSFVNRRISLPFKIQSLTEKQDAHRITGVIRIPSHTMIVRFLVQIDDCPELKSANKDTKFTVSGKIKSLTGQWIELAEITHIELAEQSISSKDPVEPITKDPSQAKKEITTISMSAGRDLIVGNKNISTAVPTSDSEKDSWYQNTLGQIIVGLVVTVGGGIMLNLLFGA